ncbi:MAG: hypothetical protein ORN85_00495, partial [Sediminibacterium sp.]|nr:hypothetical protein [Sediminibacterium sp.]
IIVYFNQLNGSSNPINPSFNQSFSIFNRYRDTTIRIKLPSTAIGNRYQMLVLSQRLSDTVSNNSYYNISTAFLGWIDTIRILSSTQLKTDSMCINLATPLTLQVRAFGGRIQDSNISPGAALYSYRWYGNSVNSNQGGWLLTNTSTAINNATLNVPNDTAANRFYYVVISDSISGSSVCSNYRIRKSGVIGRYTVYGIPSTDTANNFKIGDTVCFLGSTAFKTLTTIANVSSGQSLLSYIWRRSVDSINYSVINYSTTNSFTLSSDSNNVKGNNFIYANVYNGPQRINCTIKTLTTRNYLLIDTPIKPTPLSPQSFNLSLNDTLRNLIPAPSSTILWYNVSNGGSALLSNTQVVQSIYYVVNQQVSNNRTCQSTPRVPVQVYVYLPPQRPDSAIVSFSYNSQSQTLAKIFMPRPEKISSAYDSPNRYYLLATTLNSSGPNRTIIIDSFLRGTPRIATFFNTGVGFTYNLSTSGLLNKEKFRFFVQATNSAGTLISPSSKTSSGDSVWVISPLLLNSFRSTSWNSRSNTAAVNNMLTPAPANYIQLPTLALNNTNYTIEMWAKFTTNTPPDWTTFFNISSTLSSTSDILFGLPGNRFTFRSNANETANGTVASYGNLFGGGLNLTDWHHYAITLEGTSSVTTNAVQRLYIDGVLVATQSNQRWLASNPTFNYIGKTSYSVLPVTNYQVQDFRIWRTALSETFLNEYFTKSLTNK